MTRIPDVEPKRCELTACETRFTVTRRRRGPRYCPAHRGREWVELWIERVRAGLTVRQLADASGVTVSYINQLQQGQRVPSDGHIAALAAALGVDPARLLPRADTTIPADLLPDALTSEAG